jgi:hypothetical protein
MRQLANYKLFKFPLINFVWLFALWTKKPVLTRDCVILVENEREWADQRLLVFRGALCLLFLPVAAVALDK